MEAEKATRMANALTELERTANELRDAASVGEDDEVVNAKAEAYLAAVAERNEAFDDLAEVEPGDRASGRVKDGS